MFTKLFSKLSGMEIVATGFGGLMWSWIFIQSIKEGPYLIVFSLFIFYLLIIQY
jgi:hypothetical protein